jgi:D-cysteine desulfhydrase family pyridoxal phosphate-dependent enzyme
LSLAHLPTPLDPLTLHGEFGKPLTEHNISFWIKRDDMTGGIEWGGNKIRKLEFLLADAQQDCTAVLTIGGAQSNHCRATASAARRLGLEPHLILRTTTSNDIGTVGNLLMDRMVGSHIYTCTPGEYGRLGSEALVQRVAEAIERDTPHKVYRIPVGGSNAIGTWGYLQAVDEVIQQQPSASFDHIVFACGSGGTAAGIVLGFAMAYEKGALEHMPQLHAVGVCDDPDYFYAYMAQIAVDMGFSIDHYNNAKYVSVETYLRQHVTLHQGKGRGYAVNTPEELQFDVEFARATGIVLDPVYSGKALYHFWTHVLQKNMDSFANQSILFWHTGGALGLYDKCGELTESTSMLAGSPCQKLDVYGKGNGLNINE